MYICLVRIGIYDFLLFLSYSFRFWWWCAGFLCLVIVWSSCFDNLCVGIPSLSAEQGLSRASSSQQHPLHPELAGPDHKHDAPDPVPTVSWLPRSPDDRSQARHRFRGVWGRQPVPYRDAGPPGLQDHPREPYGYILRQKMRSTRNPCTLWYCACVGGGFIICRTCRQQSW